MNNIIRIATRRSPLAMKQAEMVRDALIAAHPDLTTAQIELLPLTTTGDQIQDRTLQEAGGKGLFTKEIEEALLDGRADLAVHSMKDVPVQSPPGLVIDCLMRRADPRDALISLKYHSLDALPEGAVIGTASVRRQALTKRLRPDLKVVPFRGNVQTRLAKLAAGDVDATFLAVAGLDRLDAQEHITEPLAPEVMLPAVAQGAIGIQRRDDDDRMANALAPLNCPETSDCVAAERGLLAILDGSCRTPIAGYATLNDAKDTIHLRGSVTHPDGKVHGAKDITGPRAEAEAIGRALGETLREYLPSAHTKA